MFRLVSKSKKGKWGMTSRILVRMSLLIKKIKKIREMEYLMAQAETTQTNRA